MSETENTKAVVVGVGNFGRHHARVYDQLPNVDLISVVDSDTERASHIGNRYDCRVLPLESALEVTDVASVAVPTNAHFDIAMECIDAGVDALVEKPFVERTEQGRRIIKALENSDVVVQPGHVERFNPAVRTLEDIVADLDVVAVTAERLGPEPDVELQDTTVMDLMIHDIYVIRALLGADVGDIQAAGSSDREYATATLEFTDGTIGNLRASRVTQRKIRRLMITARERFILLDYTSQSIDVYRHSLPEVVPRTGDIRYRQETIVEQPFIENVEPLSNEISSFIDAAEGEAEQVVTASEGTAVVQQALSIEREAFGATEARSRDVSTTTE